MPDPFVASFVIWRRVLAILGAIGFVALGLWVAGAIGDSGPEAPVAGWGAVVVFGVFAAVGLKRLMLTGPALRVDRDGIWIWRATGGVTVPWRAIRSVEEQRVHRQRFLCLELDQPELYRAPGLLGGANSAMGFGDVAVGVQGTDRRFEELVLAVQAFSKVSAGKGT